MAPWARGSPCPRILDYHGTGCRETKSGRMREIWPTAAPGTRMATPPTTPRGGNSGNCRPGAGQSGSATRNAGRISGWVILREDPGKGWHRHVMIVFVHHLFLRQAKNKFPVDVGKLSGQAQVICQETGGPRVIQAGRGIWRERGLLRVKDSNADVATNLSSHELAIGWR
jgi:hypothetical protein